MNNYSAMIQLSLFQPKLCHCGDTPRVYFLPNYGPNGEWKCGCGYKCPRATGKDEIEAVEKWNEGVFNE